MMAKRNEDETTPATPEELLPIEVHFKELQIPDWIQAGVMVANGWAAGKEVSRSEFLAAKDAFLCSPISKEAK